MRKLTLMIFGLVQYFIGYTQTSYPVTASIQIIPPYSIYLSDYATPGTEKMTASFFLNDLNEPYYNIKFRLSIEGVGISIHTNPSWQPTPVTIQAGLPARISSTALSPFLDPENLIFQGISKQQFLRTGTLPEGIYKFSIQAYDYQRNIPVSNKASINVWLVLNDPPRINTPSCNSRVKIIYPQNLVFQWMPMHASSPNVAGNTEYHFRLVHITPAGRNPNDAMLSSPSIFEAVVNENIFYYGFAAPQLLPGEQYAWRVQAKDKGGRDIFKNNGYSEVCMFTYGEPCHSPKNFTVQKLNAEKVRISWEAIQGPSGFVLRYKEKDNPAGHWYENISYSYSTDITGIKPGIKYEFQVRSKCDPLESEYSLADTFSTTRPTVNTQQQCGTYTVPPEIDKTTKLQTLRPNDVIMVDGFQVRISEASGSNGRFSGRGVAYIPFLNLNVRMSFNNIAVNEKYEVYEGKIVADRANLDKYRATVPVPGNRDICMDDKDVKADSKNKDKSKPTGSGTTANQSADSVFVITMNGNLTVKEGDVIIINGKQETVSKDTKIKEGDVVSVNGQTIVVKNVSAGNVSIIPPGLTAALDNDLMNLLKNLQTEYSKKSDSVLAKQKEVEKVIESKALKANLNPEYIIGENVSYRLPEGANATGYAGIKVNQVIADIIKEKNEYNEVVANGKRINFIKESLGRYISQKSDADQLKMKIKEQLKKLSSDEMEAVSKDETRYNVIIKKIVLEEIQSAFK